MVLELPPGFEYAIPEHLSGAPSPLEKGLDEAVLAALPEGCKVSSVHEHGASNWALAYRIDTTLADGEEKAYFLKVLGGDLGKEMTLGEYEGDKAINAIIPNNCPKPLAHGTYVRDPNYHFFLCDFEDMEDEMPSAEDFVNVVVQLHQKSASPTGKFGFHVTTHAGDHPLQTAWTDSWEEFFTRQLKEEVIWERGVQGPNEEMEQLLEQMFAKVIPRLLRPLQTNGRSIKPSLVHGDLWHGNVGVDVDSDRPVIFDPCACYAHNEYDMTSWRSTRYNTNKPHRTLYRNSMPASEPALDWDDRNELYALRNNITVSAQWPLNKSTRVLAIEAMRRLVAKYPGGYEEFEKNEAGEL